MNLNRAMFKCSPIENRMWKCLALFIGLSASFQDSYSQNASPQPETSAPVSEEKPVKAKKRSNPKAKKTVGTPQPGINVRIQMIGFEDDATDVDGNEIKFASVCAKFGKELIASFGPFKRSPVAKVSCANESDFGLERAVDVRNKKKVAQKNQEWSLRIRNLEESVDFQVQFGTDEIFVVLSDFSFEKAFHPVTLLNDKIQSRNVAQWLIRALPFETAISRAELSNILDLPLRSMKSTKPNPKDNQEILIYDLSVEGGVLAPLPIAKGARSSVEKSGSVGKWTIENGTSLSSNSPSGSGQLLYVSRVKEKPTNLKVVEERIEKRQVQMKDSFSSIGSSAYLGFRLGKSIGTNKGDFDSSTLYGIFGEFRSGILSGLKIGYDVFPRATASDETGTRFLSWSRTQIGYSFGTKVGLGPINWFDVTPRLGVTTLDFGFEPLDSDEFDSYSFIQRRSPTLGLELGAEARGSRYLTRAWVYGTYSFGVLAVDKKFKTQALRSGVDFYVRLFNFGSLKVAGLLFGMTDYVKVSQSSFEEGDELSVVELKTWVTYLGGGLTLAW
jgi:hypothetical protein